MNRFAHTAFGVLGIGLALSSSFLSTVGATYATQRDEQARGVAVRMARGQTELAERHKRGADALGQLSAILVRLGYSAAVASLVLAALTVVTWPTRSRRMAFVTVALLVVYVALGSRVGHPECPPEETVTHPIPPAELGGTGPPRDHDPAPALDRVGEPRPGSVGRTHGCATSTCGPRTAHNSPASTTPRSRRPSWSGRRPDDVGMHRLNGLDTTRPMSEQPWGQNAVIVRSPGGLRSATAPGRKKSGATATSRSRSAPPVSRACSGSSFSGVG